MASADRFDGLEVDRQQARFAGTVDIDPTDVERMSLDSEVMAIVVCRVGGASVDENSAGDLIRTNKFKIHQFALVRDDSLQQQLRDELPALDVGGDPQLFDGLDEVTPDGVDSDGVIVVDAAEMNKTPTVTVEQFDPDEVFSPGGDQSSPSDMKVRSAVPPELPKRKPGEKDQALESFFDEPAPV